MPTLLDVDWKLILRHERKGEDTRGLLLLISKNELVFGCKRCYNAFYKVI